jgi:hypothetical protein
VLLRILQHARQPSRQSWSQLAWVYSLMGSCVGQPHEFPVIRRWLADWIVRNVHDVKMGVSISQDARRDKRARIILARVGIAVGLTASIYKQIRVILDPCWDSSTQRIRMTGCALGDGTRITTREPDANNSEQSYE